MSDIIPIAEVKNHKTPKNCWIIIHNDVYNVSRFLSEHPGGEDPIMNCAGADATQAFEDVGHSEDARVMLKQFKIGSLSPEDSIPHVDPCCKAVLKKQPRCPISKTERCDFKRTYSPSRKQKSPAPSSPPKAIIVPRQRRPRGYPCDKRRWWLYAVAVLGVAAAGAFAYKKFA